MDSVNIQNSQGESININVVRYFRLNEAEYLIFSLNEVDEGGYVKLYICKVANNNANTITDDVEWNLIKDTIKTIIKSNKDNLPLQITDLNVEKIKGIQLVGQKVFKLSDAFISLLSANKKVEPMPQQEVVEPQVDMNVQPSVADTPAPTDPAISEYQIPAAPNNDQVADSWSQPIGVEAPTEQTISEDQMPAAPMNNQVADSLVQPIGVEVPAIGEYQSPVESTVAPIGGLATTPTFEPTAPASEINVASMEVNNTPDYKSLYEEELNKNKELVEQNNKYKAVIETLKKNIEEAL